MREFMKMPAQCSVYSWDSSANFCLSSDRNQKLQPKYGTAGPKWSQRSWLSAQLPTDGVPALPEIQEFHMQLGWW